ncbi:hypothetical protein TELCIR_00219 [Teladorsagia circumcincta]|uniref:Uncharacterized protein n=1 Tax=Teladorsagia circumcincta TaxID=45464 RepID=A0A2G9V5C1_TELCI|nr:hypothetical protein TELCIR_00219 [Teladorsagia circumcincta]
MSTSVATITSPTIEIITVEAVTPSEWSSTTQSITTVLPTSSQKPEVPPGKHTTDGLEIKKRRPQLTTPTKMRGQHWVGRGQFRSAQTAFLSEKVAAPGVSDRRMQSIPPPKMGSIQGLSLLDNGIESNSTKIKLIRGEHNFKLRKSDILLPRTKARFFTLFSQFTAIF